MTKPQQNRSGLLFVFALSLLALGSFTSCGNKDDCNIACFNGACVNNSCNCNTGYEGDSCTVSTTEKFIGSYNGIDSCQGTEYSYIVTVAASSSILNQLIITNFGGYGTSFLVNVDISGFNLTVPTQTVEGLTLSGSGTLDTIAKKITVTYSAIDEFNQTSACTGVWLKQ